MIRLLLLALVLANLLAFALWSGLLERSGLLALLPGGAEPQRLAQQVAPERLKVIAPGARPASPATADPGAPAGPGPVVGPVTSCVEAGPREEAVVERLRDWVSAPGEGLQAGIARRPDAPSFMVYLAPAASAAESGSRLERLRGLGVTDLSPIAEGPLKRGVSLGVFRIEEGARARREALVAQGVEGVMIGPGPLGAERAWAWLRRAVDLTDERWVQARAQLQSLAGQAPADCAKPPA
jgi:hypothetical protein